jgi:hypothetical protein
MRGLMARNSLFGRATVVSLSVALSLTTLSLPSSATTLLYKSFNDLMKEADAVVAGHVVSVNSQYNTNKEIYTFVTLDGVEVLSGSYQDSTLTIRLKGGTVDKDISHVIGSPEFTEGEHVVLFISGNGKYMVPLVGWTQGVFRIGQDPATSLEVVKDADGNRVVGIQNGQVLRDPIAQPEATILRQTSGVAAAQSQYEGSAGASDSRQSGNAAGVAAQAQTSAFKNAPTLSANAFRALVRSSAALRESKGAVSSVRVMDFSVPNANADVSPEGKPAVNAAGQAGAPVLPKRNDLAPLRDRQ